MESWDGCLHPDAVVEPCPCSEVCYCKRIGIVNQRPCDPLYRGTYRDRTSPAAQDDRTNVYADYPQRADVRTVETTFGYKILRPDGTLSEIIVAKGIDMGSAAPPPPELPIQAFPSAFDLAQVQQYVVAQAPHDLTKPWSECKLCVMVPTEARWRHLQETGPAVEVVEGRAIDPEDR